MLLKKKINTILSTEYYHVFYNGKELKPLIHKSLTGVEKAIKEHVNSPKTDKKVYLIKTKFIPNSDKKKILISCCQYTITPKLSLTKKENDDCFTIIYSSDELKKYGFELSHIKKIIKKIKKEELDVEYQFINISEILE